MSRAVSTTYRPMSFISRRVRCCGTLVIQETGSTSPARRRSSCWSKPSHAIRSLASLMPYLVRLRLRRSGQRIRPRNKWPKPWRPRRWRWRLSLNWLRPTWSSALTITRCLSKRVEAPITGLETKSAGWKNGKPPSDSRRITQRSLRSSLRLQSIAVIGKGLSKNWSGHGK